VIQASGRMPSIRKDHRPHERGRPGIAPNLFDADTVLLKPWLMAVTRPRLSKTWPSCDRRPVCGCGSGRVLSENRDDFLKHSVACVGQGIDETHADKAIVLDDADLEMAPVCRFAFDNECTGKSGVGKAGVVSLQPFWFRLVRCDRAPSGTGSRRMRKCGA
jgi:hypothetical protein